jgi:hypothetical protein
VTFYSFDTSSLLNGHRDLLPPQTFVSLWANIESMIAAGDIRCVDEVRNELARRDDAIHEWAKSQPELFVPLTADIQLAAREVLSAHRRLVGVDGGRNTADPFVIALARARNVVVVTEETKKPSAGTSASPGSRTCATRWEYGWHTVVEPGALRPGAGLDLLSWALSPKRPVDGREGRPQEVSGSWTTYVYRYQAQQFPEQPQRLTHSIRKSEACWPLFSRRHDAHLERSSGSHPSRW